MSLSASSVQHRIQIAQQLFCRVHRHSEPHDDPALIHFAAEVRKLRPADEANHVARHFDRHARHVNTRDHVRLRQRWIRRVDSHRQFPFPLAVDGAENNA